MKKLLKSIALIIAIIMVVTLLPIQSQAVAASKPALSKKKITVTTGKSKTITVKANGNKITDVSWKTSDKTIAKVSKKGDLKAKITGASEGKTTVTATVKTKAKAYKLKVKVTVAKKASDNSKSNEKGNSDGNLDTNNGSETTSNTDSNSEVPVADLGIGDSSAEYMPGHITYDELLVDDDYEIIYGSGELVYEGRVVAHVDFKKNFDEEARKEMINDGIRYTVLVNCMSANISPFEILEELRGVSGYEIIPTESNTGILNPIDSGNRILDGDVSKGEYLGLLLENYSIASESKICRYVSDIISVEFVPVSVNFNTENGKYSYRPGLTVRFRMNDGIELARTYLYVNYMGDYCLYDKEIYNSTKFPY